MFAKNSTYHSPMAPHWSEDLTWEDSPTCPTVRDTVLSRYEMHAMKLVDDSWPNAEVLLNHAHM